MAKTWNVDVKRKVRIVLLLLNNSVAHPHLDYVKNIHLEFPSPNCTLLVQTMEVGILKKFEDFVPHKVGKLQP